MTLSLPCQIRRLRPLHMSENSLVPSWAGFLSSPVFVQITRTLIDRSNRFSSDTAWFMNSGIRTLVTVRLTECNEAKRGIAGPLISRLSNRQPQHDRVPGDMGEAEEPRSPGNWTSRGVRGCEGDLSPGTTMRSLPPFAQSTAHASPNTVLWTFEARHLTEKPTMRPRGW